MTQREKSTHQEIEQLAKIVEKHNDFRVLRRLDWQAYGTEYTGGPLSKGVILDTETTGMNKDKDKIIEFAMIVFEFDPETGAICGVVESYNSLEDPGVPIPLEATAVNNITNEMVAGHRIDDEKVALLLANVSLVIAHNAAFDRPFVEKRFPIFSSVPWGCSLKHIDWSAEGIKNHKLDYLAYSFGFFFDAHRAEIDCLAVLEILKKQMPVSAVIAFKSLLEYSKVKDYRIYAHSSYDAKDLLKARSYQWDGEKKLWHITLPVDLVKAELEWLGLHVYCNKKTVVNIEEFDAYNRFSIRVGRIIRREILTKHNSA